VRDGDYDIKENDNGVCESKEKPFVSYNIREMKKLLELLSQPLFFYLWLLLNSHMKTMKTREFWCCAASHSQRFPLLYSS
jgi:hypothetical protein